MAKKILQFNPSIDFCLENATKYFKEGEYVTALTYLDRLDESKLNKTQFERYCQTRTQICHVFGTELGNVPVLNYFARHGFSEKLSSFLAYAEIENDAELQRYRKQDFPDFLKDFMDTFEGEVDLEVVGEEDEEEKVPKGRRLMFTVDMIGGQNLGAGDKLMKAGKFEEAIVEFKKVSKNALQYWDAISSIALCHLFIGNYKKSYEINKMVLENRGLHLQSLLQMLSLCNILEMSGEFNSYLEKIQSMKHSPEDSVKVANILIDSKKFDLAIKHFEYAFDNVNYTLEGYVTFVLTLYNAGKQKRAVIEIKELLKFFPDNAVLWQLLSEMDGREEVSYHSLFADVCEDCVKKGMKFATSKKLSEETFLDAKKLAYIKYACAKSTKAIECFDNIIAIQRGEDMMCELLYHPVTSMVQRANILRYLMKNHFEGKVLFKGSNYRYLKISYPKVVEKGDLLFIAYAFAFSTLAYFTSGFETQLKRAMTSFVSACEKNEIEMKEIFTPDMVSALVVAKLKKISFDIICDFAGVEKKKFMYVGITVFGEAFRKWDVE